MSSSTGPGLRIWGWVWRTALRDARGSRGRALLYCFSMAIGISALVAIGSFRADMEEAITAQAKSLVGADLILSRHSPIVGEANALLDRLPGKSTNMISFVSNVILSGAPSFLPQAGGYSSINEQPAFVRIRAIQKDFPFYGELESVPKSAAKMLQSGPYALIEESLKMRSGIDIGDVVRINKVRFTIVGLLKGGFGEAPSMSAIWPRIFIPHRFMAESSQIYSGSRVLYRRAFRFDFSFDIESWLEAHQEELTSLGFSSMTVNKQQARLTQVLENLSRFLNLIACLALLIGGVGVASAVFYHMKQKERQIATLRCLGANAAQITWVFLIQVSVMALIAIFLGIVLGVLFQQIPPHFMADLLPFSFTPRLHWRAVLIASGWGVTLSMLLTLEPLLRIRKISPLASFRMQFEPSPTGRSSWFSFFGTALAWWGFASFQLESMMRGAVFLLVLVIIVCAFYFCSKSLSILILRLRFRKFPFVLRYGLSSLFRPSNQTSTLLTLLGVGVFLLALLISAKGILLSQFQRVTHEKRANFIAFDIGAEDLDAVKAVFKKASLPVMSVDPIITLRLSSLKGQNVSEKAIRDFLPSWALEHEYRATFRGSLSDTEELAGGVWAKRADRQVQPIPISLETGIAKTLNLQLGDSFTMEVSAVPLRLEVASLRQVDWQSMQPNFYIVFPEGVFGAELASYIVTTRTSGPEDVAALQKTLAKRFSYVSSMDLNYLISAMERLFQRAAAVVQFLVQLCMLIGLLLLADAIWNSRYQRFAEFALLRTLGATSKQMVAISLIEYFFLGLSASFLGIVFAVLASYSLARFFFLTSFTPDPGALLLLLLSLPLFTLILGFFGHRQTRSASPRRILKEEGL